MFLQIKGPFQVIVGRRRELGRNAHAEERQRVDDKELLAGPMSVQVYNVIIRKLSPRCRRVRALAARPASVVPDRNYLSHDERLAPVHAHHAHAFR